MLAFDPATIKLCDKLQIPVIEHHFNGSDFRGNAAAFRTMGAVKARFVLNLLENFKIQTVVVSDTDVVWVRDPTDYFTAHPKVYTLVPNSCIRRAW